MFDAFIAGFLVTILLVGVFVAFMGTMYVVYLAGQFTYDYTGSMWLAIGAAVVAFATLAGVINTVIQVVTK